MPLHTQVPSRPSSDSFIRLSAQLAFAGGLSMPANMILNRISYHSTYQTKKKFSGVEISTSGSPTKRVKSPAAGLHEIPSHRRVSRRLSLARG
jgi:hypothetical protein